MQPTEGEFQVVQMFMLKLALDKHSHHGGVPLGNGEQKVRV
jgi:hypothetical protein